MKRRLQWYLCYSAVQGSWMHESVTQIRWSGYFILKLCSTLSDQFSHILACEPINLHKHCHECTSNPYAPLALEGEVRGHLTLSPWNLAPWADWSNRCVDVTVPEILASHWYKYKYCHPVLGGQCRHSCVGRLTRILCVSIRTGLQVPSTGPSSRLEISRCWNHTISTRSSDSSSCWTESYGTICFLSCKQTIVIKCSNIFLSLLLLFPAAFYFYWGSQTFSIIVL